MSSVGDTPRSRRAILGAALGGLAATAAAAIGKPLPASATDNQALLLGQVNQSATKNTGIKSSGGIALAAEATSGVAFYGKATGQAFYGETANPGGSAVLGVNHAATGPASGVDGSSFAAGGIGAIGNSYANGTGVVGHSTNSSMDNVTAPPKTGVYGKATQDTSSRGVFGQSTAGHGVRGEATTGTGVSASATTGTALAVSGRATFSRSGRKSIAANKSYVDVSVPGGLAPTTLVVATLETYRAGVYVAAARKNYPSAGIVRIQLNKVASTTSSTTVGWVAIN